MGDGLHVAFALASFAARIITPLRERHCATYYVTTRQIENTTSPGTRHAMWPESV